MEVCASIPTHTRYVTIIIFSERHDGKYGNSCEYLQNQPQTTIDKNTGGFPNYISEMFDALYGEDEQIVKVYNRPVKVQ